MVNLRARQSIQKVNLKRDVEQLLEDAECTKPTAHRIALEFTPDPKQDWGTAMTEEETGWRALGVEGSVKGEASTAIQAEEGNAQFCSNEMVQTGEGGSRLVRC